MNTRASLPVGLVVACALLSPLAPAAVVYDGGPPNPLTGAGLADLQADILSADLIRLPVGPATVTAALWWGFTNGDGSTDEFHLIIYPVVAGRPVEPALASAPLVHVQRVVDDPFYRYHADLADPILLEAASPLALVICNRSGPGFDDDWYWTTSGEGDGLAIPDTGLADAWFQDRDYAFQLIGVVVPEPGALALAAAPALAIVSRRHRRPSVLSLTAPGPPSRRPCRRSARSQTLIRSPIPRGSLWSSRGARRK